MRHAAGRIAAQRAREPNNADPAVAEATCEEHPADAGHPHPERLERALRALPPEQREVIALKIDGELTFAQIARVLDISVNTAASRYRYALEKLRSTLEGGA